MVVAELLRLCGHGEHDDAGYVAPGLKQSKLGRDCLKVAESQLLERQWAGDAEFAAWRQEAAQTVEAAVARVQREPAPDPYHHDWCALASRQFAEGGEPAESVVEPASAVS